MALSRLDFDQKLRSLMENNGYEINIYFQPPQNISLKYPCIIYSPGGYNKKSADNIAYNMVKYYSVTLIDRNPDSILADELAKLPMSRFDVFFVNDNLNHWHYNIY